MPRWMCICFDKDTRLVNPDTQAEDHELDLTLRPQVIDEYIARDGYFGAHKALNELSPDQIIYIALGL